MQALRPRLLAAGLRRTPTVRAESLSRALGFEVVLKLECLQVTGSFKPRGAFARMQSLTPQERTRGVIAVSAGNHALALAWAAARAGVAATIVTWDGAPEVKMAGARAYGARVVRRGTTPLQAFQALDELRAQGGATLVHPFDDTIVIEGQATVGAEIAEDAPDAAAVIVPVGGNGLVAGVAAALHAAGSTARVIGVEPEGAPTLHSALAAGGEPVVLETVATIADGLSAPMAGRAGMPLVQAHVDDVVLVSDDHLREAMRLLAAHEHVVAEPAGAAGLAALLAGRVAVDGPALVIVSGGNVQPELFAEVLLG